MNLIEGDGVMMSKSAGTGVFVDMGRDGNHHMFGSIMALPDSFILPLFRGCTRVPMEEVRSFNITGSKARDAKLRLAYEVVAMFWGAKHAKRAQDAYVTQFQEGGVPENTQKVSARAPALVLDLVTDNAAASRSDAKRKMKEGAVSIDGKKVTDLEHSLPAGSYVLRVGRHIFNLEVR